MKRSLVFSSVLFLCACEKPEIRLPPEPAPPTSPAGFVPVALNPMEELDFISRPDFDAKRTAYVNAHSDLCRRIRGTSDPYTLSATVFGAVVGGKPWWGMLGICCNGSGPHSIDGPSEESRFIANPYLLLGVLEQNAYILSSPEGQEAIFPEPVSLAWSPNRAHGWAVYNVSDYFRKAGLRGYQEGRHQNLDLCAYNARDLGLETMAYDLGRSSGVTFPAGDASFQILQYVHCGGSCGYPGGCNNMSPADRNMEFHIDKLPARIVAKFWKLAPSNASDAPNFWFVVELR